MHFEQEQSKLLWQIRDELEKSVTKQALQVLLELNNQEIPAGESKVGKRTILQIWILKIICMVLNFAAVDIHEKLNCNC